MAKIQNETAETVEPISKTMRVLCERLNLRKAANKDAGVLSILDKGTEVTVQNSKSDSDWAKVTLSDGRRGFVMRKFIG